MNKFIFNRLITCDIFYSFRHFRSVNIRNKLPKDPAGLSGKPYMSSAFINIRSHMDAEFVPAFMKGYAVNIR